MAGIYLHIPFCKKRCHYCDFYSSTNINNKEALVQGIIKELQIRSNYLQSDNIQTIYFGGGTPSLLTASDFKSIFEEIGKYYTLELGSEITVEANPDDLTPDYLLELQKLGVNRLSIGIQSFFDDDLMLMNRRHTVQQGIDAIENAVKAGIDNISIDLIYGLPGLTAEKWSKNLEMAFQLPIKHLSSYHLTYEPGTVFYKWLKKSRLVEIDEESSWQQFEMLNNYAVQNGFKHYEISNLALDGYYSRHNCSYWSGEPYLGLGPSAHSFNGDSRQWNVSNVEAYLKAIEEGRVDIEKEVLTPTEKHNEFVMTNLRTQWGLNLIQYEVLFGKKQKTDLLKYLESSQIKGLVTIQNEIATLTLKGMFVSDSIMADLCMV
jgi:oxygen-independent coproporphyrinogen-3 oxidase